jgi:hypothetical protein
VKIEPEVNTNPLVESASNEGKVVVAVETVNFLTVPAEIEADNSESKFTSAQEAVAKAADTTEEVVF